eukprot:TRINITY_DN8332_c0_g1_i2.p1 TRINITY_DN8332_c0_g1~~TRINITY_DN8332_c0_g1_i2.p1  ORF type:complete len:287 (-),score=57.31 TRINITY_DN8332_c0_g1_i2:106-966(-)
MEIDLTETDINNLASNVRNSLLEKGYVVIKVDSGVAEIIEKANKLCLQFFEQTSPLEKHMLSFRTEEVGFTTFGGNSKREGFVVQLPAPGVPFPWPYEPEEFEPVVVSYFTAMQEIGKQILELISLENSAEAPLTQFLDNQPYRGENGEEAFPTPPYSNSVLFIRHYPSPEATDETNKKDYTHSHTDSGMLTLKPFSNISGLQIFNHKERVWDKVEEDYAPNKIIVFVGEELCFRTKGKYRASVHNVVLDETKQEARVSLPFQLRGDTRKFSVDFSPNLKMVALSF